MTFVRTHSVEEKNRTYSYITVHLTFSTVTAQRNLKKVKGGIFHRHRQKFENILRKCH
jgi:hypothetical protein